MNRSILISIISYLCFFNGAFASFQMDKLSHSLESIEYIEKTDFRSESVNTRVRFIVIHYTSSNWEQSLKILTKADYEVSSHYLIPESFDESYKEDDLFVYKIVDENDRAWHAGESNWQGRSHINDQSIGIELVNNSECYYQPNNKKLNYKENYICSFYDYDPKQIQLLIKAIKPMLERHDEIKPTHIIGHSDIAPNRKYDPGPRFPWYTLYQNGIGAWYDNETVDKYWRQFTTTKMPSTLDIQCALRKYGYEVDLTGTEDEQTYAVVRAFHYHFQSWNNKGDIWIRPGIALYGISPLADISAKQLNLKPVMQFVSKLIAIKPISKGECVGYNSTWVAKKDSTLGVVSVGYGDGYSKSIISGGPVLVNGRKVPLVGLVSMDLIAVDLGSNTDDYICLLYTSPSPRDGLLSRMPSSA